MAVMAHECPACERDSVWMEQACQKCVSSLPLTVNPLSILQVDSRPSCTKH